MVVRSLFSKKKEDRQEMGFPEGLMTKCPECRHIQLTKELEKIIKCVQNATIISK